MHDYSNVKVASFRVRMSNNTRLAISSLSTKNPVTIEFNKFLRGVHGSFFELLNQALSFN